MEYLKDKRLFRRYSHTADFYIAIEGSSYKASTVDFSLSGLCVFIEGTPPITIDSIIDLRIEDMELDIKGKVVWLKLSNSNLIMGIEKMSLSGILKYYPLADILLDLQRSDATGILQVKKDLINKQIYFNNGIMLFATSNLEEDRIEEILLKKGQITTDQYYHVCGINSRENIRLGKTLVDLGYLKPHDFILAVKNQAEEIILGLFQWENGEVTFEDKQLSDNIIRLKLSASNLIFQGLKKVNKPEYFKHIVPPFDTVLYFSNEPINLFQDINLSEKDRYVLSLLDGHLTIKEILSISSLGSFNTLRILCALLFTRMICIKESGTLENRDLVDIIEGPRVYADEAFLKKMEDFSLKYQSMDYYSILEIDRDAPLDAIKRAYYKNAKEFHPDRHIHVTSEEIKNKLNLIFRSITTAYKTLSDPKEKEKYNKTLKILSPDAIKNNAETAKERFTEGKKAFNNKLYARAHDLFAQAVYFDDSSADYHFYLGLTYKDQNKLREAETEIKHALLLKPNKAEYVAEIGDIYLALGFTLRAKSSFEKAIKLDPSITRAVEGLRKLRNSGNEDRFHSKIS
jgi:curved DNA-binding protein CbpA